MQAAVCRRQSTSSELIPLHSSVSAHLQALPAVAVVPMVDALPVLLALAVGALLVVCTAAVWQRGEKDRLGRGPAGLGCARLPSDWNVVSVPAAILCIQCGCRTADAHRGRGCVSRTARIPCTRYPAGTRSPRLPAAAWAGHLVLVLPLLEGLHFAYAQAGLCFAHGHPLAALLRHSFCGTAAPRHPPRSTWCRWCTPSRRWGRSSAPGSRHGSSRRRTVWEGRQRRGRGGA